MANGNNATIGFEKQIWDAACVLWGHIPAAEYRKVIVGLIFLRYILAKQLNISPHQLSYVTHSGEGEGLLFYGSTILPFVDRFPKDTELYRIITTKPQEQAG